MNPKEEQKKQLERDLERVTAGMTPLEKAMIFAEVFRELEPRADFVIAACVDGSFLIRLVRNDAARE